MNWIKAGREALEWTPARMAATADMSVADYLELEGRDEAPEDGWYYRVFRTIFEVRNVWVGLDAKGERLVIGPNSPEALRALCVSTADQRFLESLLHRGTEGKEVPDATGQNYLRAEGLIQYGSVVEQIIFEGDIVTVNSRRVRVRLSHRGKLWLQQKWDGPASPEPFSS